MKKRLIIATAAVLAAGLVLYLVYGRNRAGDRIIRASGIIEGIEVNLAPKVAGRIKTICCREGDMITQGRTAIEIESDDIRASVDQAAAGVEQARADIASAESSVENARASVQGAEADIARADAEVEQARVQMDEKKKEMDRAGELYGKAYVSRESFDLAVAAHDTAVAALSAAKARLNTSRSQRVSAASQVKVADGQLVSARARLKAADANLAFNQSKLRDTVITSPIAGAVTFRALEQGEYVTPGTTVMTVVDTADLYVRVDLEETLVAGIPLHASARITAEGLQGKEIRGQVTEIGRYAEFATQRDVTRGRQDIRTFRVKVKPDDPGGLLKPGMTVFVEIAKKA